MSPLHKSERIPLLCYVTDRRSLDAAEGKDPVGARDTLLQKIAAAVMVGVNWIQIREKDLSSKECSTLTRDALQCVAGSTAGEARVAEASAAKLACPRILVNDRLDVALATQAGGVHLGETSMPPKEARRLVKSLHHERDFLIGVSCHSLEAAKAAERGSADYLFFGPVFSTPSKAAYGPPQGLTRLAEVCRAVGLPVLAIGGINLENAAACFSAGASGIAAIHLFQDAQDIAAVVRTLRKTSA